MNTTPKETKIPSLNLTSSFIIWSQLVSSMESSPWVIARMDTPKSGETLKFVYISYQPILVKSYQRFAKFNYGVTKTICES